VAKKQLHLTKADFAKQLKIRDRLAAEDLGKTMSEEDGASRR